MEKGVVAPTGAKSGYMRLIPAKQSHRGPGRAGMPTQLHVEAEAGNLRAGGGHDYHSTPGRSISPMGKSANPREKYGRGGKAQRLCKYNEERMEIKMAPDEYRPIGMTLPTIAGSAPMEVIPETQACQLNGNGKIFKEIPASIGLDSPILSHEIGGNSQRGSLDTQQGNTPIRNSAETLIALGKHMFTPRHGRSWEGRSKSPLGS